MAVLRLALDRNSVRTIDQDGRMHIESSRISIAAVNPYYGKEIPGWQELGLDANRVYHLLRDPVELERGAETFARLNVLSDHVPVTVETMREDPKQKQLIVGNAGSKVNFDGKFLNIDLCIFDATAIKGIDDDSCREISCGYRYVPVMESGTFEGQAYDGRMTQIQGNHITLVREGRAGPDVLVADRNPFKLEPDTMAKQTKFGKAIFAMLCAASPKLATDATVPGLVLNIKRGELNRAELEPKLLALDSELDPEALGTAFDAMADMDDPEPKPPKVAEDESDEDEEGDDDETKAAKAKRRADKAKPAMDAATVDKLVNDRVAAATAAIHATNDAMRHVRTTVGDIVVAMDSAAAVFGFALDKMGVKHEGITDAKALRAMYDLAASRATAPTPRVAMDHAGTAKRFPGLANIAQR